MDELSGLYAVGEVESEDDVVEENVSSVNPSEKRGWWFEALWVDGPRKAAMGGVAIAT